MGFWQWLFGGRAGQAPSSVSNIDEDNVNLHLRLFRVYVAVLKLGDTKDGQEARKLVTNFLKLTGENDSQRAMEYSERIAALQKALSDEDPEVRRWAKTLLRENVNFRGI
jgi:hypothetical protein